MSLLETQMIQIFKMKFPAIMLLRFYATEQFWAAEDIIKAVKSFQKCKSVRHKADLVRIPQICLRHRICER
jgi:hypothetical protein